MRAWLALTIASAVAALGCGPPPAPVYVSPPVAPLPAPAVASLDAAGLGDLDDRMIEFAFDGGHLEFELYRNGDRILQVARNRYAVPVMIAWTLSGFENVAPAGPSSGVAYLPPAPRPHALGEAVVLAELRQPDPGARYRRDLHFRARFGDPRTRPAPYAYALPYPHGLTFSVLQGFHGAFSHKGSNEYAIDFDCPVATRVLAARPGVVVAANAAAQGSGTTAEYLDYNRTNFVIIQHDDGTLGEYMHLAPSSITVKPGDRVERLQPIALSGNTGFSSTPHLHFQVMTAGTDGVSALSFPFSLAVAPQRVEAPVQGRRYAAWE
ncbi:MAG TPA: M23 family metallopeptidase [Kofleriaceae bacterium]|nr:M23 family metallopeptidase [Kofleriaceae bacterium]